MPATESALRAAVLEHLRRGAEARNTAPLAEDANFFEAGVLDSYAFVELLGCLEERFGLDIDFGDFDPAEFMTLGGLLRCLQRCPPRAGGETPCSTMPDRTMVPQGD